MGLCAPAAHAQSRLEAHYTATLSGLPVGKGTWSIELDDANYSASADGATTGLIRVFTGGQGSTSSRGTFPGTSTYSANIKTTNKSDKIDVVFVNGAVKDVHVDPPTDPDPERVPLTDAMRQGVSDPMASALVRMPGTGDLVSSEACQRTASVFDGRLRYDLKLAFKRMDKVKADKGYVGPVVVCAVYFTAVGGHVPTRAAVKYLSQAKDMEVWLAPIAGTRILAPFRFQVPTPVGHGVLEADQFLVVALPPKPAKSAKTQ
ncbi:MAG: DUF3108 domain-containing protein [Pseudolabrys sp.]|nr:DUF3108 domain-containing protein [Pseudolabrys sp.]